MTDLPKTFNFPECTCGEDHDQIGYITTAILDALEDKAEPYTPTDVGALVAEAAEAVGWHRDPEKAERTFNRPGCLCAHDHDGVLHIVSQSIFIVMQGPVTVGQLRDLIDDATAKVGWVKA
ncbi:hypothetical protein SEA_JFLIX2_57 [Rhodococcus phage Jflix2]|nr:hypothetical protein SEA_JFLIX2_57 [Rhodococcus phage Jflix2]